MHMFTSRAKKVAVLVSALASGAVACSPASHAQIRQVNVEIKAGGLYVIDGKQIQSSALQSELRALKASPEEVELHITAMPDVQRGLDFISICADAGIRRVGFITKPASN